MGLCGWSYTWNNGPTQRGSPQARKWMKHLHHDRLHANTKSLLCKTAACTHLIPQDLCHRSFESVSLTWTGFSCNRFFGVVCVSKPLWISSRFCNASSGWRAAHGNRTVVWKTTIYGFLGETEKVLRSNKKQMFFQNEVSDGGDAHQDLCL